MRSRFVSLQTVTNQEGPWILRSNAHGFTHGRDKSSVCG